MNDWPVTLGAIGVIVTAVACMISLSPGVLLGLAVMWVALYLIYARWEHDKEGR